MLSRIYGMVIGKNISAESVPDGPVGGEVRVRLLMEPKSYSLPPSWFIDWTLPGGEKWLSCAKIDDGYILRFSELADFQIDKTGSEIICEPKPGIPENTIQHLLLNQVVPLIINLRGGEALHASAVLTSHGVVAFAGPTGSGKSTIAASLLKFGYQFVSDDCLTLHEREQTIYAIPAYPGLRLWKDTNEYLFGEDVNKKSVAHYSSKLRVDIEETPESYNPEPKPFVRLYDIVNSPETDGTSDIVIERLSTLDSLMALIRCSFRLDITDQDMLTRQFHFLKRVANRISVRRLTFPRDFNLLPVVREAIINDLRDLSL